MMLSELKPDKWARIVAIEGGLRLRQRLFLRGLVEGSIVRMISSQGPITIEVDRNTVSIGRGMAGMVRIMRL